jgi:hypothetical protein
MDEPIGKECSVCGEKIYGFSEKDLKHKMIMHSLKHTKEEKNDRRK